MKSMVSNKGKTSYGRISMSMTANEATKIINGKDLKLIKHLNCCLEKLEVIPQYTSAQVYEKEKMDSSEAME